jgi:hypothetical protein
MPSYGIGQLLTFHAADFHGLRVMPLDSAAP